MEKIFYIFMFLLTPLICVKSQIINDFDRPFWRFDYGKYDCHCGDDYNSTLKNTLIINGIFLASMSLDALGDGLNANANGSSKWGHFYQASSIGLLVVAPVLIDNIQNNIPNYILKAVFIRAGSFDIVHNLARGYPIYTTDNSSYYDYFWSGILESKYHNYVFRVITLTIGFSIKIHTPTH